MNLQKQITYTGIITILLLSTVTVFAQGLQGQGMFNKSNINMQSNMIKIQNEDWSKVKPSLMKLQTGYIAYVKALASIEYISKYQVESIVSETNAAFEYIYKNQSLPLMHMYGQLQKNGKGFGKFGTKNQQLCYMNEPQISSENYKNVVPLLKTLYDNSAELSKNLLSIGFITKSQNDAFTAQHEKNYNYITSKNIAPLYFGLHPFIPRYVLSYLTNSSK